MWPLGQKGQNKSKRSVAVETLRLSNWLNIKYKGNKGSILGCKVDVSEIGPESWETCSVGDICRKLSGGFRKPSRHLKPPKNSN